MLAGTRTLWYKKPPSCNQDHNIVLSMALYTGHTRIIKTILKAPDAGGAAFNFIFHYLLKKKVSV